MSVIRKQPFIEKVIKSLSADDLVTLKTLINTNTVNTVYSIDDMPSDNGVYAADFMIESGKIYSSFLIKNASYTVVIAYHKYQDLSMFNIVNNEIKRVNEYLNINELRRIVDDCLVEEGVIGSGGANAGDVLTADGEGGTEWKNPADSITDDKLEAGAIVSVFGFNSEGEPVKGEIPSGSVVDAELDEDSTNPVQNKVVTAALDGKLGINSYSEGAGVGYADRASNIEPVSDDSGATQTEPFIMQGTGTANNTASVDTRPFAKLQEKRGNVVVVNQQCPSFTGGTWTTTNVDDYSSQSIVSDAFDTTSTHKILIIANVTLSANCNARLRYPALFNLVNGINFNISDGYNNSNVRIQYKSTNGETASITVPDDGVKVIDLTQMFNGNGNIPADLLSHPEHFSWYYNGSLAHNAGSLEASDGRYLVNTGRQLFNTATVVSGSLEVDGTISSSSSYKTSDYIIIAPNRTYYLNRTGSSRIKFYDANKQPLRTDAYDVTIAGNVDATFTATANAIYVRFTMSNSNVNSIDLSLYYATGDGYDQYYSYKAPKVYDTGSEELLAYDVKLPDGSITRATRDIDLSQLTFTYNGTNGYWATSQGVAELSGILTNNGNFKCEKYNPIPTADWDSKQNGDILINHGNAQCFVITSDSVNAPSGHIQVKLVTPTTSEGTPFTEDIEVDDYGMNYWLNSSNELVSIPQGNKIFYPVDYVLFIDSLHKLVDGDAEAILNTKMSQADFDTAMNSFGYYKQEDLSSGIVDSAGLTYEVKKCYKIGNVITLSIQAQNNTGATIAAGTTLFKVPSGTYNSSIYTRLLCLSGVAGSVSPSSATIDNSGNVTSKELLDGSYLWFNISYDVS